MLFKKFRRTAIAEMRKVEPLEIDWFHKRGEIIFYLDSDSNNEEPLKVSISNEDLAAGCPRIGDMIARNPDNHRDQWLVNRDYFEKNFKKDISKIAVEARDQAVLKDHIDNTEMKGDGFDFGHAIAAAKAGKKVARTGWNGSGMFAYIVPAAEYPAQTETAKKTFGEKVPYRAYWALKTAQGDVATWAPSGSDSLSEDWMIVE